MVRQGVHGQRPQPGVLVGAQPREPGHRREVERLPRTSLVPQRVGPEVAARRLLGDPALLIQVEQLPCRGLDFTPRFQDDGSEVEIDTVQDPGQPLHREPAVTGDEPQRSDPVLQVTEHRAVRDGRMPLPHVPAASGVPLSSASSYERREAGETGIGRGVARRVQGTRTEPVLQRGGQGVFGCRTRDILTRLAQYAFDKALPLLMGRIRKLGCQRKPVVRQDRHARMLGQPHKGAAVVRAVTLHSSDRP